MKNLNKRTLVMIGVLLVLLIYYVIDSGFFSGSASSAPQNQPSQVEATPVSEDKTDVRKYTQVAAVSELSWGGSWGRDPFFYVSPDSLEGSEQGDFASRLFGTTDGSQVSDLKLTGISWAGRSGFALINGNVVSEGDAVGGYRVSEIALDYVLLDQGSKTIRLQMEQ